ncbi:hypothetical protein AX17_001548 [Amanita inopinata Kibby_2008]|nr:hypothetical protein AX17_001548 [Amanita inopinata Kibby_2008]
MNTATVTSKAGPCSSWPSTLYSVLLPAPRLVNYLDRYKNLNPRHARHPPGLLWKQTLGHCVYCDLTDEETLGSLTMQRRRFARLECMGLSGVVFYEIPLVRGLVEYCNDVCNADTDNRRIGRMTLKSIFGDPADPSEPGMNVDDLLDNINARVVYFPSYACTSFIAGQAISSFFQQHPGLQPLPARDGFTVDATAFTDASFTIGLNLTLNSNISCSSLLSFSLESSVPVTSSIPLIRVHSPEDQSFDGVACDGEAQTLIFGSPTSTPASEGDTDVKSNKTCLYSPHLEDCQKEHITADLFLESVSLGTLRPAEISMHNMESYSQDDNLASSSSSDLGDYSQLLVEELVRSNGSEDEGGDTSISTLGSTGPGTPPRNSPLLLLSMEDEYPLDDRELNEDGPILRNSRSRPRLLPLNLCARYDVDIGSSRSPDVDSLLTCSSSSSSVILDVDSEYLTEPLTPVLLNTTNIMQDLDLTPTHLRTPLSKSDSGGVRAKLTLTSKSVGVGVRSRIPVYSGGKENVAPSRSFGRGG